MEIKKDLKVKQYVQFTANEGLFDHSPWHKEPRHYRFTGRCVACGIRTYEFDDGENDPRGPLGDHANAGLIAEDYDMIGEEVPLCCICESDYDRYNQALSIAKKQWKEKETVE